MTEKEKIQLIMKYLSSCVDMVYLVKNDGEYILCVEDAEHVFKSFYDLEVFILYDVIIKGEL